MIVRIFISSPGDVKEEREKAKRTIALLQHYYGSRVTLVPVLWEELPLGADASFQQGIDLVLEEKHRIDIAIFILWSRMGSPLGPPPKRDGTPYRSGTEREWELMLTAREQSGGTRPHLLAYSRADDDGFSSLLTGDQPAELLKAVIDQREIARGFIREAFHDEQGRNLRAYHTYDKPLTFASRLKVHLKSLIDDMLGESPASLVLWDDAPYRGLRAFDVEHAPIFFGRETEVCEAELLLRRRAATGKAFVVITGASGVGKSSLARAGVAAGLLGANLDEAVKEWRLAIFQPGAARGNLLGGLVLSLGDAGALPELQDGPPTALADFCEALSKDPGTAIRLKLNDALHRASTATGGRVQMLLLVDQMEELWTDRNVSPEARERFLEVLAALAAGGHAWVLGTLRADLYPLALESRAFVALKEAGPTAGDCDGVFELHAPLPAAVHRLIREPALRAGVRFERQEVTGRSLDEQLLNDASGHRDALPLLEYALQELYDQRTAEGLLTFAAYERLGGVEGALARRAETVFTALPEAVQRELPRVLGALVHVEAGEGGITRRRAPLSGFPAGLPAHLLVEAFVRERFFVTDGTGDATGGSVTVAHEALLRVWSRASLWIEANIEFLRTRAWLRDRLREWKAEKSRPDDLLLPPGKPLEDARSLRHLHADELDEEELRYIQASLTAADLASQRRRRLRIIIMTAMGMLTLGALGAGAWAWVQKSRALAAERETSATNDKLVNLLDAAARADAIVAADFIDQNRSQDAAVYLARALTYNPQSKDIVQQALEMLAGWTFPWPDVVCSDPDAFVVAAAFASSGRTVIGMMDDGTVRAWDATTGAELLRLRDDTLPAGEPPATGVFRVPGAIFAPHFSEAGWQLDGSANRLLVSWSPRHWGVYDIAAQRWLVDRREHEATGGKLLSPDGGSVAVACGKVVQVWDVDTGRVRFQTPPHPLELTVLSLGPGGRLLCTAERVPDPFATGGPVPQTELWDVPSGRLLRTVPPELTPDQLVLSGDGHWILPDKEGRTAVIQDAGGNASGVIEGDSSFRGRYVFSPDGRWVAASGGDGGLWVWHVCGGTLQISGDSTSRFSEVLFSPDSSIVAAYRGGRLVLWRTGHENEHGEWNSYELARLEDEDFRMEKVRFSPDSRYLVAIDRGEARVLDATTARCLATLRATYLDDAEFSPDGEDILASCEREGIRIFRAWKEKSTLSQGENTLGISDVRVPGLPVPYRFELEVAGRDARMLAPTGVHAWDVDTGRMKTRMEGPDANLITQFSRDGRRALLVDEKTTVIWDAEKKSPSVTLKARGVTSSCFSPDGERVATVSEYKQAQIWRVADGELLLALTGTGDGVFSCTFSPDGRTLVGFGHASAHSWDAKSGALRYKIEGLEYDPVDNSTWAFSPDGARFAVVQDKAVSVRDSASGGVLVAMEEKASSVRFSPDGKFLAGKPVSWEKFALWNALTGQKLHTRISSYPAATNLDSIRFSRDGHQMTAISGGDAALLWTTEGYSRISAFRAAEGYFMAACALDGGRQMTVLTFDGVCHVVDILPNELEVAPVWFPDFLRLIGGRRLNDDGDLEDLAPADYSGLLVKVKREVMADTTKFGTVARRMLFGWRARLAKEAAEEAKR